MSTLSEQMAECIALKKGDTEFALTCADGEWVAAIGNPCPFVALGESAAELQSGDCSTPDQAVAELLAILRVAAA